MTGFLVLLFSGAAVAYQYEMPYYQRYSYPQYQTPQNLRPYYYPYNYDDEYVPVYRNPQPYSEYWPSLGPMFSSYPQQAAPAYPSYRELDLNSPLVQQQQLQMLQQQQLAQQQQQSLLLRAANQPQVSPIEQVTPQEKPVAGKALEGLQQNIANQMTNLIPQQGMNTELGQVTGRALDGMQSGQGMLTAAPIKALNQMQGAQTLGIAGRDVHQQIAPEGNKAELLMVAPLKGGQIVQMVNREQREFIETPIKSNKPTLNPYKEGRIIGMVEREGRELAETPAMAESLMVTPIKLDQMVGMVARQSAETSAMPVKMEQIKEGQLIATDRRQLVETPAMHLESVMPTTMTEGQIAGDMIREKRQYRKSQ